MRTRSWLIVTAILVIAVVGGLTVWHARADNGAEPNLNLKAADRPLEAGQQAPAVENPVVEAIPYRSETEYEPDPFEPGLMRSSKTEVKELILVYADGTIERKRAW